MADESYRWLDLETAERLLRGESLEAVDETTRDQAELLARALAALTAEPPPTSTELPGEEAALAAFRKARADRADDWESPPALSRPQGGGDPADPADAGLVRIGAPRPKAAPPRRRRSAHFGLTAVLAAGVVGGAAVVAGTGVLAPSGNDEPEPGASVSADASPTRPLGSSSPRAPEVSPSPEGSPSGGAGSRDTARGDTGTAHGSASQGLGVRPEGDWRSALSSCRDLHQGKELNPNRKRSLEGAAGGSPRVWTFCKGVLSEGGAHAGSDDHKGGRGGHGGKNDDKDGGGRGGGKGRDDRDHDHDGDGDGQGDRGDKDGRNNGQFMAPHDNRPGPHGGATHPASLSPTPGPSGETMSPSPGPDPEPSPSYSAL
ncbi:hypothetical protein [Streptomyces sp. NRRL B-3229]|uniref:hypothetical protein n=1 Tax=Streptomyces sp. NRRL B-3229 TaxID=1463836 RepID=UPI0005653CB3|nr:hypothetical protein [Streptomyces sp. NRRL B-3229]